MRKKLWLLFFLILGAVAVAAWACVQARGARRFRAMLDQVRHEMAAKQYGRAHKRLVGLGSSRESTGEVDYLLGICEY